MNTTVENTSKKRYLRYLKNILAGVGTFVIAFGSGTIVGAILNLFY